jgi:hypothetical protein
VFREDGTTLHETRPPLPLEGEWTLAGFCDHLATLELWPEPPEWDVALRFRNWAFESAALDLALARPAARCTTCSGWSRSRSASSTRSASARSLRSSRCSGASRAPPVCASSWTPRRLAAGARRRGRGDGRGRHDRLQGSVRIRGRGSGGIGCALRPRARGVPERLPGGTRTTCPRSRNDSAITFTACPTTRRSAAPRTSARRLWPRAW